MPTADEWVNAALKRFLSQNRIQNELIDYLKGLTTDLGSRIFPASGLFTYPVTITYGAGVFSLSIAPSGTIEGTDSLGHTIELVTGRQSSIPFEDDGTNTYWIGMKYIEIPNGIYDNPRTGKPEYDKWMEEVGERDNPSSVADGGGGTIDINVNSIFESGVDHSGRTVRVWLEDPLSGDPAVAFEDCTVSYASPNNTISTTGSLGQGTISTLPADYQVACLGVTVRESATDPFGDEYIVLGNIDSSQVAPAGVTDSSLQLDLSGGGGHSLQAAYDGSAGSGSGRVMTADDGAAEISQQNTSMFDADVAHAALRIRKDDDQSLPTAVPTFPAEDVEMGIDIQNRIRRHAAILCRTNLLDVTANDFLRGQEDVDITVAGATVTFTRVGVDLDLTALQGKLIKSFDLIELFDSTAGNDGLYYITTIPSGTTLTVTGLDFAVPTLAQEVSTTLKAKLYRSTVRIAQDYGGGIQVIGAHGFAEDDPLTPIALYDGIAPVSANDNTNMLRLFREDGAGGANGEVYIRCNGDIETTGDVQADGDIQADSASDFQYSAQKTGFWKAIHPWKGMFTGANWSKTGGGLTQRCALSIAAAVDLLYYSFQIPKDLELIEVEVLLNDNGNAVTCYLKEVTDTWTGTEAVGTPTDIVSGGQASSGAGGVETVSLVPDSTETSAIDKLYEVQILPNVAGTCAVFAVRFHIGVTELNY